MKILQRAKKELHYKFLVVKSVVWDGKIVQPGDEIEIQIQAEADGMVQNGRVRPVDLIDGLTYVALRAFTLPGQSAKFETKKLELVSLKADDALRLMLDRSCLPADPDQWRPYAMKLGAPKVDYKKRAEFEEMQRLQGIQKVTQEVAALKGKNPSSQRLTEKVKIRFNKAASVKTEFGKKSQDYEEGEVVEFSEKVAE